MRILLVTYANRGVTKMGVTRYYNEIADILEKQGHELIFFNHPTPVSTDRITFRETVVPMFTGVFSNRFAKSFHSLKPDAVHIQSEMGLGLSARHFCKAHSIPYSGSYHTHLDIVLNCWTHIPRSLVWKYLRWYYKPAGMIHTFTPHLKQYLSEQKLSNPVAIFPPGVNLKTFYYDPDPTLFTGYPRPYFMTFSRISKEKNIEAFLNLSLPGTKFVIGEGPHKKYLEATYGQKAVFISSKNIRNILSTGDVFVFPSRFDTFGITNLEAMACGLPVACYSVTGPMDIIQQGVTGYHSENLEEAALSCLKLKKEDCIEHAKGYTWENTAREFLKHQVLLQ
jgi:glycosyltransferase involved in cell wall biosynthesis